MCGRSNTKQLYPFSNLVFRSGIGHGLQQSQCLCQWWFDSGCGCRWGAHLKWQLIWSACSLPQHPLHGSTDPLQWQAPCSSQVSLSCSPLPQISTCIALGLQKVYAGTACAARWLPNGCYSHFHCFLTHCHYLPLLASIQARLQCTIAHVTGKSGM